MTGPSDGPVVLFLHGGGQTRHSWGNAAHAAASIGFCAITMDLRGHGDSDRAPDGNYTIDAQIDDIRSVAMTVPGHPVLVGASLGGLASLAVVGEAEERIARALVLVDVVPKIESEGAREIHAFMTANPDGFESLEHAASAVASYLPHRNRPSDPSGLMKNLRLRSNGRYYWHWDPAMMEGRDRIDPIEREQRFTKAARNVDIPTLLIRGGMSRIVSMEGVRAFQAEIPQSEFVNIEQADHMVAGDNNDAFNAPLLEFLEKTR